VRFSTLLRERDSERTFSRGDPMNTLEIILIVITFVVPAVAILADNGMWKRKES
jgi:hypothetical protein